MSTLNFVIGTLEKSDTKLVINNKTSWNIGISFIEAFMVVLGIYTLTENIFGNGFSKVVGVVLISLGFFVASRPHLEELIFDKIKQEMIVVERQWFRVVTRRLQISFSSIIGLNVKAEYSETVWLHTFWLDLGDGNYLAIGKTSEEKVHEVINAISSILNFDESQVRQWGKSEA
ncbi:hypothetical protein [Geminocystis sp. GBBB08]|uniref:hypothetical protein n=1 Tax=Geminocystis sp. GBBB08 TaxID=2604140 RepID=UPI0027E24665|nr:hypothetical protein [Geminocystis sp. GBBB08]MBL1209086.1 hypothetical protein [Geminocystis sp. GBBB08]